MVTFQDTRLYLKGTCNVLLSDIATGNILYQSTKSQTNNATPSVTAGEIRAGLGNGVVAVLSSDSALNVALTAADFSMATKAAQVGSSVHFGAIAPTCQVVEATGSSLTIDVTEGVPVAQYGFATPHCYVVEVGAKNTVYSNGTAYPISDAGVISDFVATPSKKYKVWYFINRLNGQVVEIPENIQPGVYHYTAQMAVYSGQGSSGEQSNRVGWFYLVIPMLKLGANSGVIGDQTTPDTTDLSGMALAADEVVETETCADCTSGNYAYYVYIPDDADEGIEGLAIVGGVITLVKSTTAQTPIKFVMANGELVQPDYTQLKYTMTAGTATGTSVNTSGLISAGSTAGAGEILVEYPKTGDVQYSCVANVVVTNS